MILIREAEETDAAALIKLRKSLFKETEFLLLEPEEYKPTIESEGRFIKTFKKSNNSAVFLAIDNNSKVVGFMGIAGGTTNRSSHKAKIFMGILKEFWGNGVGKLFFKQLFSWTNDKDIIRYELTTAINNTRAFSLYKSVGFEVECIKKHNICVNGELVDEYQMFYINPKTDANV